LSDERGRPSKIHKKELMKMTIKKLTAMPYAQAHIEIDDEQNIYFFSYTTLVATIDNNGWLKVFGTWHSQTTRKHIGAFVREYAKTSYSTAKVIERDQMKYNIHTGEVVEY
jgi:hypothetical protein